MKKVKMESSMSANSTQNQSRSKVRWYDSRACPARSEHGVVPPQDFSLCWTWWGPCQLVSPSCWGHPEWQPCPHCISWIPLHSTRHVAGSPEDLHSPCSAQELEVVAQGHISGCETAEMRWALESSRYSPLYGVPHSKQLIQGLLLFGFLSLRFFVLFLKTWHSSYLHETSKAYHVDLSLAVIS